MSVGVAVMAHPVREEQALRIADRLGGVPVSWDSGGPPSPDPGRRWKVGREAWRLAAEQGHDWSLVVQDDVSVCEDLVPGLSCALELFPDGGVVSVYCGTGRPEQELVTARLARAAERNEAWIHTTSLNWGVAFAVPTATVNRMLEVCSSPIRSTQAYDFRIAGYYRDRMRWRTWYTVPSLVDHIDGGSLVNHDREGQPRVSHNFPGEKFSAMSVDWTRVPPGGLTPSL